VDKENESLIEDTSKIESYLESAKQKKRITEEQIKNLDAQKKVLTTKINESPKISPENELKIKELEEKKSDVEME